MSTGWLVVILGLALAFPAPAVLGQDESAASPPTGADAAAEDATATEPPIVETSTEAATVEPTQIPPIATAPTEQTGETPAATPDAPSVTETPQAEEGLTPTADPTETPTSSITPTETPVAQLSYAVSQEPACASVSAQPDDVAAGGWIDYACTYNVRMTGMNLSPDAVKLDWAVEAHAGDGWAVQLRPVVESDEPTPSEVTPTPTWTPEKATVAEIRHSDSAVVAASGNSTVFPTKRVIGFEVRVARIACQPAAAPVNLTVSVDPSLPAIPGATIERIGTEPKPFHLAPAPAANPEPAIAFGGPLDFGTVGVDATGPDAVVRTASVQLTIGGLDRACGTWQVVIFAQPLDSGDGAVISPSHLALIGVDGAPLPNGACDLDGECLVAEVRAPDAADGTITFTLDISLAIPQQVEAGGFGSLLAAAMRASGVDGDGS